MTLRKRGMTVTMDASEDGEAGEFYVQVRLGDQTRAELEGKRMGMSVTENPIHLQALMAWSAMVREGHFTGKFVKFREACADLMADKGEGEPVDPTDQDQSSD